MDVNDLVQYLQCCEPSDVVSKLHEFQAENQERFDFAGVKNEHLKQFVDLLFKMINSEQNLGKTFSEITKASSASLRIVSRSKECVKILSENKEYSLNLLSLAGLSDTVPAGSNLISGCLDSSAAIDITANEIKLEALRILCNCIFHSRLMREFCIDQDFPKYITKQLADSLSLGTYNNETTSVQIKIMFLISAFENRERARMNNEYQTTEVLVKMLEEMLKKKGFLESTQNSPTTSQKEINLEASCCLLESEILLFSEILKTLFNITVDASNGNLKSQSFDVYKSLTVVIHCFLTKCAIVSRNMEELLVHVAHMLVNIPKNCLDDLTPVVKRRQWQEPVPKKEGYPMEYELRDMSAVITLMVALDNELKTNRGPQQGCSKAFSILASLCHVCRCLRLVRKYLRVQILPPLKEASVRPEHSNSLKGRLVKLMTDVDMNTKNMAADLLFVLCKENADRLVKYTGYGNAAGLLASRGLMSGSKATLTGDYSSDDEDSDTEEYNAVAGQVDAMTGAVRGQGIVDDPLKGMTDEEKQANAEELMSLISRLTALNVVKPMQIGADGRPREIDEEEAKEFIKKKIDEIDKS